MEQTSWPSDKDDPQQTDEGSELLLPRECLAGYEDRTGIACENGREESEDDCFCKRKV